MRIGTINKKELQAIAQAAAKNIKTEDDLRDFQQMLTKITVEAALNAELDDHLGFERHEQSEADNNRNGYSTKTIRTEVGQFERDTPRDRAGSFEPKLVKKHQRRFTSMDDKIIFLYAQGMTTREIVTSFKEMYGADVSPTLISKVTNAVIRGGCRVAVPSPGCGLSYCLPGLYCRKNPARQEGYQQSNLPGLGCQYGGPKGIVGALAIGE